MHCSSFLLRNYQIQMKLCQTFLWQGINEVNFHILIAVGIVSQSYVRKYMITWVCCDVWHNRYAYQLRFGVQVIEQMYCFSIMNTCARYIQRWKWTVCFLLSVFDWYDVGQLANGIMVNTINLISTISKLCWNRQKVHVHNCTSSYNALILFKRRAKCRHADRNLITLFCERHCINEWIST